MARITKISVTLCALLFTLPYTTLTQASGHVRPAVALNAQVAKSPTKSHKKTSSVPPKKAGKKISLKNSLTSDILNTASSQQCAKPRKGSRAKCVAVKADKNLTIAQAHKIRVQKAQKTAMNKLMGQIGKPYRWGGASPRTGFDCSGLVYYAYKDLVKFRIPRTANEMYHLRDAASVRRGELESGDLVFFRTRGRGTADHVGVYVGNGKFIQSPRSGQDIQISSLSENYWQRHYVGAKRVMTTKTIR